MKPRSFYRWKSFWLGMLVLGFLGWAWIRSIEVMDRFSVSSSKGGFAMASEVGWVSLFSNPAEPGDFHFFHEQEQVWEGLKMFDDGNLWEFYGSWISLSYRLLILLFFGPWIGFLVWRIRKQLTAGL